MASVLQQYHQLADRMATQITGSYQSWTDFLTTAARLYKYPYHEQLMIYAQRPDATACAEYDLWNKRMGRYIRRGAKGIALIDHSGDAPRLRYVFDTRYQQLFPGPPGNGHGQKQFRKHCARHGLYRGAVGGYFPCRPAP